MAERAGKAAGGEGLSRRAMMAAGLASGAGLAGAALAAWPMPLFAMEGALAALPQPQIRHATLASGRAVEFWHWPADGKRRGHILFSHGAASSPRHYQRLCGAWAAAGFAVLAPLHVDSIEHPRTTEFTGLASWSTRIDDMRLAAQQLKGAPFIAAGHSYGGLTAIALGGGVLPVPAEIAGPLRHEQARAVLAFSPPPAIAALVGAEGYAPLAVPSFHQTGTRDLLGPNAQPEDWLGHLDAYEAAPAAATAAAKEGRHYALVLPEVDHYFGGLICKPDAAGPATPEALGEAVRLSTLFIKATAQRSSTAQQALNQALGHDGRIGFRRK